MGSMRSTCVGVLACALLVFGCDELSDDGEVRSDGGSRFVPDGDGGGIPISGEPTGPTDGPRCTLSEAVAEIAVTNVDKVDLLFVVDNSGSMREEQEALRSEFPRLIQVLATGDTDQDGTVDFPPAKDLHLGVVSSDMGLVGVEGIPGCGNLGDDGIMNNIPGGSLVACQASYPRFITYTAGVNDPLQTANDFACIAALGTEGCGFEQQLEAGLKALWPSVDVDPSSGEVFEPNRITFLSDVNGFGGLGHGDLENAGFLRNDPVAGLSLISIVVVTDEEDCSSADTAHFTPDIFLDPSDPLAMQDLNLRCFFNPQNLYSLDRYVNGFRALRPGNENLVVFSAIAGVPEDLVSREARARVDFGDDAARDGYYDGILSDPRMQEVPDPSRTPEQGGNLTPSCITETGRAFPPRRLVEVARRFGAQGSLGSICVNDFGPAIDGIIDTIATQLGGVCLPRRLERDADGLVGCDVVWELPPPNQAPSNTPTRCGQGGWEFLQPNEGGSAVSDRGGQICKVQQLRVEDEQSATTDGQDEGWFYDDFSEELQSCQGNNQQRIAFTPGAKPPTGVTVKLRCVQRTTLDSAADCDEADGIGTPGLSVGRECLPEAIPESGFDDREAYVETANPECDGGACLVFRLRGDPSSDCVASGSAACDPSASSCPQSRICADAAEVEDRVYCSCRCSGPADQGPFCECPGSFSCVDVLEQGGPAVRGGYCVRNGTFTR